MTIDKFDVPILLIIFRRKNTALKVIKAIAKVKPKTLYISQDGPRNSIEKKEVLETRQAVISEINWDCDLKTYFHDRNLGFKKHIPEALDVFFKDNEYGIYLEDDNVPSKEFFHFQRELLRKYKDDKRIFAINGTNLYPHVTDSKYSYRLSEIGCFWGLGIWRRSWNLYNPAPFINNFSYTDYKDYIFSRKYFVYLKFFLDLVNKNMLAAWDYQFVYSAIKSRSYFISPTLNLVSNIGLNSASTNLFLQDYKTSVSFDDKFKIVHPKIIAYSKKEDKKYFDIMYKFFYPRIILNKVFYLFPVKVRNYLSSFLKSFT